MEKQGFSAFNIEFIKQVGLGINISRSYPKGHPSLTPVIQRLKLLLKEIPLEKETISIVLLEDVLMVEDERLDSKRYPIVKSLAERLDRLGVKSVTFSVYATDSDIKEFFSAMGATTADVQDYSNIEALVKARGITTIEVNKLRVGVVSSDEEGRGMNWEGFLESVATSKPMTEEDRAKELGGFLAGLGIKDNEPVDVQSGKIISGLEKLALLIADQYGEDRWAEYSMVFARLLAVLSPNIKKNIVKARIENKKIAMLFKELIPTMPDQDIVEIIATKAKERTPTVEQDVLEILKNISDARLPTILSSLRVNVPELNFEKIATQLMMELKATHVTKGAERFATKDLESDMRQFFPKLRDPAVSERIKAIDGLMDLVPTMFERKNHDLIRLLVDRFDSMVDAEAEIRAFARIIDALKSMYFKSQSLNLTDLVQFISKKFGKHLMRREAAFLERKNTIIKAIMETKDNNYVPELISLLWDPGTFGEAREALIALSDFSTRLLIDSLRETEDRAVRMKIIDVLVRAGEKAVVEVKKLLASPEWFVRRNGLFIIGEIKAQSAVDDVGRFIEDPDERIQLEVVDCLAKIGGEKVEGYIKKALDSKYPSVVIAAIKVLPKAHVKHKLPTIEHLIKTRKTMTDAKIEDFKCDLINLLGRVGDDSVVATLLEIISERGLLRGEVLLRARECALNALAQIGTPNAIKVLSDLTRSRDHFVSAKAQDILRRREGKQA